MTPEELVNLFRNVKLGYDKQNSWEWWVANSSRPELNVYQVNEKTKKIALRGDDDTASTAIYQNLGYVDFGGEARLKDPVDRIMEVTGLSFLDAVKLFLSWEGYDINENINYNIPKPVVYVDKEKKKYKAPYKERFLQERVLDRVKYKKEYEELAKGLFRGCTPEEKRCAEGALYIGFLKSNDPVFPDRIFIPEFDQDEVAWGHYLYNRNAEPKGLLRKDAKRVLFGSHLLKKYPRQILYCEGHSDTIVNIAKGYASVTTGSATKDIKEYLPLLEGRELHDFPDLDIAGAKGAIRRRLDIIEYNLSIPKAERKKRMVHHKIYWWAPVFYSDKLGEKIINNRLSPYDPLYPFVPKIKLVRVKKSGKVVAMIDLELLDKIIIHVLKKNKINIKSYLLPSNWKLISKKGKKMGYDFVDFHEETELDSIKKEKKKKFLLPFSFSF
jgi:hypothetical protein